MLKKLIKDMQGVLPAERIYDHPALVATYAVDASYFAPKAKLIVDVMNLEEVSGVLKVCSQNNMGVTFRGAGTAVSGQACGEGVLVRLMGPYWKKVEVLDDGKMFWAGSGVIGIDVNVALAPYQRKMGADPASISSATIGGIIANNSAGMCCMVEENSYHAIKGMRLILADGTYLDTTDKDNVASFRNSHKAMLDELSALRLKVLADNDVVERIKRKYSIKNTIGYTLNSFVDHEDPVDILMHLMVGSEGTLGFIHEVLMETIPTPPIRSVALMFFPSLSVVTDIVMDMKDTCNIDAAEVLDYNCLIALQNNLKDIPDVMKNPPEGSCAMLVETKAWSSEELEQNVDEIFGVLNSFPALSEHLFTSDEVECEKLWNIRRSIYPAITNYREADEYVLTEDINIPVSRLAEGCEAFQELFTRHGYSVGIMGHAFHGNLHFSIPLKIAEDKEVARLHAFMVDLVNLITERFDGSLKAEHGTGRAMAPFVRKEWGDSLYEVTCAVKKVFDPESVLNPGVLINEDSNAHTNGLKSPLTVSPYVDLCVECGFCEQVCPSKNIGFTPRQRISLFRAVTKLRLEGKNEIADEWEKIFRKYGEQLCATDGLCRVKCPLGVDVASLIRSIRGEKASDRSTKIADYVTDHLEGALKAASLTLGGMSLAQRVIGDTMMSRLAGSARNLSGESLPLWNKAMPKGGSKVPVVKSGTGKQRIVYFPSCAVRTMGTSKEDRSEPLMNVTVRLLERAGYEVVFPKGMDSLCCGKSFETKGFMEQADKLAQKLSTALLEASGSGECVVLCDTSPCLARMKKTLDKRLVMMDPIEFTMKYVADRLNFKKLSRTVALHPTCSTRTMGLDGMFSELASKCVENVVVPKGINCCGFSGDKGFHKPELNRSALENLKGQIEHCDEGYSVSRTCEIGLTLHGGKNYRNILYLVEEATR
ncbi:FAD-binding and (Fe-S)-binding domain-containing protein [Desulfovibrio sp. UCD-KL4C]|uniref:FAD-binding and (Fe-S)-binding domain-containing protein n=1 Tax=Desulfovibrio sp. UCD-KL4C TaxID=2578120 RepID=UPI0025BF784F|nr:FAD-binding and (Fe-S)-binding domain-containing protein [Desulfovibrio sp. UCD-KL4C]